MAIGFARVEFVKRSLGRTVCAKAAYNGRCQIYFEGNAFFEPKMYDWSWKEQSIYHEILIPKHAHQSFKNPEILWNCAEKKELRKDSQLAYELVVALPDDKIVSVEDRTELVKSFVQKHFVDNGLGAQIDIHPPQQKTDSLEKLDTDPSDGHNWHAHVLITTRRFTEDGTELEDKKARDMMPKVCKGKVVSGSSWGTLWTAHQNHFFEEKGYGLRVDPTGIIAQEHLGPVRMRSRAFALLEEHNRLANLNNLESVDAKKIVEKITETQSYFTKDDLDRFLQKHVSTENISEIRDSFWNHENIVQLIEKKTGELTNKFTSKEVIEEEKQILRLADRIHAEKAHAFKQKENLGQSFEGLTSEQKTAFQNIIKGNRLSCIHGFAGTGKSRLLGAIKNFYEDEKYTVRAFGPDNATSHVLKEKGFSSAENVYRFLFALHHDQREIKKGKEIWVLDEAGKLGNKPLLELMKAAEKKQAQIIFAGCTSQLPSVERGGMFKTFCNTYGSQVLEDIQRQRTEKQRQIIRSLAHGDMSATIDKLVSTGSIKWSSNKKEAAEELIKQWTVDRKAFTDQTSLIVACTNDEVRVLNELARIVRKGQGELGDKELLCETVFGKVYVSTGDRIEFRKNDRELGVTNGTSGILIEAESNRFSVLVKENDKKQKVIRFDPQSYHGYQLGYATTYYRSQGRTVDRAYVLHGQQMSKEMFYVGLTRHVEKAYCFVSKEEVSNISDLKRQVSKETTKINTLHFSTQEEVLSAQELERRNEEIKELKESGSVFSKLKGYSFSAWDSVSMRTGELVERFKDRRPNPSFFDVKIDKPVNKATIQDVNNLKEYGNEKEIEQGTNDSPKEIMNSIVNKEQNNKPSNSIKMVLIERDDVEKSYCNRSLQKATDSQKLIFKEYFESCDKASTIRLVVEGETESSGRDIRKADHFKDWQEICGKRNELACKLKATISNKEIEELLGKKACTIINEQALRHEALHKNVENSDIHIEARLKENMESLLYRLFPDGPVRKDNTTFRFRGKGSLAVSHRGEKAGLFYDFENQEGGGLVDLIKKELNLNRSEAKNWAKNFLGTAQDINVPKAFSKSVSHRSNENNWICLKPDAQHPAPTIDDIPNKKLNFYFEEKARHAYRDENGDLLFYILRLTDKRDSSKKAILPLSYGYFKENANEHFWNVKGYEADKKPLYNLHLLKENLAATILIVEGEKAADAAKNRFKNENFICMTWSGGASAVTKSDWSPLIGRNVIVWPDNDEPGFKAGEKVCSELRKVGIQSLKMVDKEHLVRSFPTKWDLADPLPEEKNDRLLKDMLILSREKGINPDLMLSTVGSKNKGIVARLRANDILWRVDERLRPDLETKYGAKQSEIRNEILQEAKQILGQKDEFNKKLKLEFGVGGVVVDRLAYQCMLYKAEHGKDPSTGHIESMKQTIQSIKNMPDICGVVGTLKSDSQKKIEISNHIMDRVLEKSHQNPIVVENAKYTEAFKKETTEIISQISRLNEVEKSSHMTNQRVQNSGKDVCRSQEM